MDSFGLLGRTLGHSWSPEIHRQLVGYPYELYEVEPEEVERFLASTDLAGMNVTIPYKKTVLPLCVTLSDAARSVGSVNTLVRTPAGWHGDNTDYAGFAALVRSSGVPVTGKKALIFGTGGASLAVLTVLRDLGADPVIRVSRSGPDNYENLEKHADAAILVNATPVGMYPKNGVSPVELAAFPACEAVFDLIYNPLKTKLVLDAEARGIPASGGLLMLVAQARRSAEQFAGRSIPDARVTEITENLARSMRNIVLIGMPGCGKTTVGKLLAQRLGREFMDADAEVVARAGTDIPSLFASEGEAGFRARETAVLADLGKRSSLVLATGGGCVTRPENAALLRQNGVVVWLKRALDRLPTSGRPLSQQNPVQALYAARRDLYAAFADYTVESDEILEHTVSRILEDVT